MAVDFSLLPAEIPESDKPPSRLVWAVVFLLLVLAGVFVVLLVWPKHLSTQTSTFWGTIVLFPIGIPALIVLLRFQHYQARKLDIQISNKVTRQYNERVFAAASVPVAILGVSHRFSVTPAENTIAGIRSGALRLAMQELFARDSEPAKVRWLEVPGVSLRAGTVDDDRKRQAEVTRWLFREMLVELDEAIRAVSGRAGLGVHLIISGMLADAQSQAVWQECWSGFELPSAHVTEHVAKSGDLQIVDAWLDQVARGRQQEARLIVSIQLHSLLSGSPPKGAAEAGVALLLMPDALASQHEIPRIASLHRPVRGTLDRASDALTRALKWSDSTAKAISSAWQTGLDLAQSGVLRTVAVKAGLEVQAIDLDSRVGHAGIAAPWLAIACAASSLNLDGPRQIVFVGQAEGVDCAVLREVSGESSSTPAMEGAPASESTNNPVTG